MSDFAIQTRGLGRRFGDRWAVQDLNLEVPRGAVYGFLGLNGAGKSTTIRMLMGLLRRHAGEARVLDLDPATSDVEIKRRTGYVADQPGFYDWMTIEELCRFVQAYRKKSWDEARAANLLNRFRLPLEGKIGELSKGQRAKTTLVLALAFNPDLLILDEPTDGLDPVARREFVEGVLSEFQEQGKSVLISSHLVIELAGLVDHIGVLHEGKLAYSGPVDHFTSSVKRVRMTFKDYVPPDLRCPGLRGKRVHGREALIGVGEFNEERVVAALKEFKPESLEIEPLNLEEAFIEFVGEAPEPAGAAAE